MKPATIKRKINETQKALEFASNCEESIRLNIQRENFKRLYYFEKRCADIAKTDAQWGKEYREENKAKYYAFLGL